MTEEKRQMKYDLPSRPNALRKRKAQEEREKSLENERRVDHTQEAARRGTKQREAEESYEGFTAVVDRLLDEAQKAADLQETMPGWRFANTPTPIEFSAKKDEGSYAEDSQARKEFIERMREGRDSKSKGHSQFSASRACVWR